MDFYQEIIKICDKRFLKMYNTDPTISSNVNAIYVVPNDDIFFKLVNDIFIVNNKLLLIIDGYNDGYNWYLSEFPNIYIFSDFLLNSLYDVLIDDFQFDNFKRCILKKKISEII